MISKLYISTIDYNWHNLDYVLLNEKNINKLVDSVDLVNCCTSVEDLSAKYIHTACDSATEIILVGLNVDDISLTNNNCFLYGRLFNELVRYKYKVKNFSWNKNFNYLKNNRLDNTQILWTAGCSITYGVGVAHEDRWGSILSKYLDLSEVSLSQEATSVDWSADQILRSDIKEGDIVVWGLTNVPRVEISVNWNFIPSTITHYVGINKEYQYWSLDYFESETQVLSVVRSILQVINFCQKIKARLYLANILDVAWLGVVFQDFKNFIDLTHGLNINDNILEFIDLGSDNQHPGPKQHQQYAEKLYNFIKENNHGRKTI